MRGFLGSAVALLLLATTVGCAKKADPIEEKPTPAPVVHPPILMDGSSTVHPISEGVLALYASRLVTDVDLKFSGTGGGFKLFCRGKTDVNSASRPISPTEIELCKASGVDFIELPVAFDGVVVVVAKENDFVQNLRVSDLKKLFSPEAQGTLTSWEQLRGSFPDKPIELYGPGLDSGTFDFFTSAILGESGKSRADYKASEDDEELANLVAKSPSALGYFGLSHYLKNRDRLRAVAIDDEVAENGKEPVGPSLATVQSGEYQPLARPLFLYVSTKSAQRPEVADFVNFYLRSARLVAPDVGSVGLSPDLLDLSVKRFDRRVTGPVFGGLSDVIGLSLADLMQAETALVLEPVSLTRPEARTMPRQEPRTAGAQP
jgi:phosphate transport system substrate-binding protein